MPDSAPASSPRVIAQPRGALVLVVLGCVLFLAGVTLVTLTEGGEGEFGYAPFTPEPLPFAAMRGFTVEQLVSHVARIVFATPGLLLIWLGARRGEAIAPMSERALRRASIAVATVSTGLIAVFVFFVFRSKAIVDDELVYRMQAALFRDGRLADPRLPFNHEVFTVKTRLGFTGKYLFGEPLAQVPGLVLGYPALLHVPVAALTLWAFYRAVLLLGTAEVAAWSVIFVACSPMFIMTSATAQSQATSLLCVVLAILGYAQIAATHRKWLGALLVGLGIGFGVSVRLQVALPVGAVLVPMAAWSLWRRRAWGAFSILGGTLAAWAALVGVYDHALTGSAFTLPWFLTPVPEHYGFGQVWWPESFRHTPLVALENIGVVLVRLNAWWLGWPTSFLMLWLWWRYGRKTEGARVFLWVGLAVVVFEFGYYSTGISDTGPIYHYELLLPGALLAANAVREGLEKDRRAVTVFLTIQFGLGWTSFVWLEAGRLDRLVHAIHDQVDVALAKVKPPALLLYEIRCTEAAVSGWVNEQFPERYHSDRDPIVTYQRPPPKYLARFIRAYPDRACWYFHIDPSTHKPAVMPCEEAGPRLLRATAALGDQCLWIAPTATRLGWYDPWTAIRARLLYRNGALLASPPDAREP